MRTRLEPRVLRLATIAFLGLFALGLLWGIPRWRIARETARQVATPTTYTAYAPTNTGARSSAAASAAPAFAAPSAAASTAASCAAPSAVARFCGSLGGGVIRATRRCFGGSGTGSVRSGEHAPGDGRATG